jgi:sugar O-acyltransferase (sialic acid O-acetyltransferase NeuD family)
MLLAGAKGLAKQLLPLLREQDLLTNLLVYDQNPEIRSFYEFAVTHDLNRVENHFKSNDAFILGMGNPQVREKVFQQLSGIGGSPISLISSDAIINEDALPGEGSTILTGVIMENGSRTGIMSLLNLRCLVCHDVQIGDFCEIAPGAILLGESSVGKGSFIGAGAIVNPLVRVGSNAIVASGSVVTQDVPDNCMVAGVPAKIKSRG